MATLPRVCVILLLMSAGATFAQELILEEVRVEATFDLRLETPPQSALKAVIDRLSLRAETERALELATVNRTPLETLLNLTKYFPVPLGASDNRVDTFFLQNYLRPDLYPSEHNPLFADDEKRGTR